MFTPVANYHLVLIREALLPWKYDRHRDFDKTGYWEQITLEYLTLVKPHLFSKVREIF